MKDNDRIREEQFNKTLLSLEYVIAGISTVSFLVMVAVGAGVETLDSLLRAGLIVTGTVLLLVGCFYSVKIEREAGYYECPHCGERHVPTMKAVILAPHIFRSRLLKCPKCGQRGYHKKVLTKE